MKSFLTLTFLAVALCVATANPLFGDFLSSFTRGISGAIDGGLNMAKTGNSLASNAMTDGIDAASRVASRAVGGGLDISQRVSNGFFNTAKKMAGVQSTETSSSARTKTSKKASADSAAISESGSARSKSAKASKKSSADSASASESSSAASSTGAINSQETNADVSVGAGAKVEAAVDTAVETEKSASITDE